MGLGRTGCHDADQAAATARAILAQPNLRLLGVQGYGGNWQHMEGANARASAVAAGMEKLGAAIAAIRAAGGRVDVVTGGGTGTFSADAAQGVRTDGPTPEPLTPKFAGCAYRFFGDEHGMIVRPAGQAVARGERVALAPGHIDPTLDRYDLLHLVQGDVLVDIVRLEARGASQ